MTTTEPQPGPPISSVGTEAIGTRRRRFSRATVRQAIRSAVGLGWPWGVKGEFENAGKCIVSVFSYYL